MEGMASLEVPRHQQRAEPLLKATDTQAAAEIIPYGRRLLNAADGIYLA